MEYTFLVIISLILVFTLDNFILKTKLWKNKKFWILLIFAIVLQTVVDNWLNGRWWFDGYIVGPYGDKFYSGILIWNTPLENYFYGISLIWMNVAFYEKFVASK